MASSAVKFAQPPQQFETLNMKLPAGMMSSQQQQQHSQASDLKRKKFKLEPIKVLEPSSKKLTIPESQRIMFIMDELIKKIENLEYVHLIIDNQDKVEHVLETSLSDDERKVKFDKVFLHMCKYHHNLMSKYDSGDYADDANDDDLSSRSKHTLEQMIKKSCQDILRVFHTKPTLLETFKKELGHLRKDDQELRDVLELFHEVRDIIYDRLLTTPVEQKEKIEYIKELLLREKTNNEVIKRLRDELNVALKNKKDEIDARNAQIRELDANLKQVERFGADLVKRTKLEAEQAESSEIKASDGRKAKLQQELNQMRQDFQSLVLSHRDVEQQSRKDKYKHELNVESLISRYDDDMTKKQDELDEVTLLYEEESKQLKELEEKFKPLEEEYLKIMEDRRMLAYMRQLEEETLNKKIKAAVTIQSFWRGFKLRKGLFKKKKGKGKGKAK